MISAIIITISLLSSITAPAELASEIYILMEDRNYEEALPLITELYTRMPHNEEILYNYSAVLLAAGEFGLADSLLEERGFTDIDTLDIASARTTVSLANGIMTDDYCSVESVSEELKDMVISGEHQACDIHNLEAALNWLNNHESPEDSQSQDDEDSEQNDSSDDSDENENQSDESEDEQDDSDSQPDEEDTQQQEDEQSEQDRQSPPSMDEMTPEQAQAILDMLSEPANEDEETDDAGVLGAGDI